MRGTATFSRDGRYRYSLTRTWGAGPRVCFVMLNPSTADADRDDPTIRRCIGSAQSWGFGGLVVVNLFAFRATRPGDLRKARDPVGPRNDGHIRRARDASALTVAAWGAHPIARERAREVGSMLGEGMRCLGTTIHGAPRHPLYLRRSVVPRAWTAKVAV